MITNGIAALAALALFLLVVANIFAPARLGYPENLRRLDRFVAQVFIVHSYFIAALVLAMAALAAAAAVGTLAPTPLSRTLHTLCAIFWGVRVATQLFYYDKSLRGNNRGWDVLFTATFIYLTIAFAYGHPAADPCDPEERFPPSEATLRERRGPECTALAKLQYLH